MKLFTVEEAKQALSEGVATIGEFEEWLKKENEVKKNENYPVNNRNYRCCGDTARAVSNQKEKR